MTITLVYQMVSILIGVIYFGQNLDQDGVMNINGAIFMFLTNMTFQNIFAVINVSTKPKDRFIQKQNWVELEFLKYMI